MSSIKESTKGQLKSVLITRIAKGQAKLDTAHMILFVAWHEAFCKKVKRVPSTLTRNQMVDVLVKIGEFYTVQRTLGSDEAFVKQTSPWLLRVRARAAAIRTASGKIRECYMTSASKKAFDAARAEYKKAQAIPS